MDSCCTRTFNFKMSVRWSDLSEDDRQTNRYVYHNIHRIPFNASDGLDQADVLRVLRTHLPDCNRHGGRIACYKGGDYVRSTLIELDLFRLDLNCLKCPKWMGSEAISEAIRRINVYKTSDSCVCILFKYARSPAYTHTSRMDLEETDVSLKSPFTCVVAGPTGCGKTVFVRKLLASDLIFPRPRKVIRCYSECQSAYDEIDSKFVEGLTEEDCDLIIIDDWMN